MTQLTCFKAYDIRGELGEELNEDIAYRIGRAYGEFLKPGKIVVGGRCAPHQRVTEAGAGPRADGRRHRRAGYRPERYRRDLLCHLPPRGGRRYRGDREPQPDELQRHETGAREREAHQRRYRAARYSAPGGGKPVPAGGSGTSRDPAPDFGAEGVR